MVLVNDSYNWNNWVFITLVKIISLKSDSFFLEIKERCLSLTLSVLYRHCRSLPTQIQAELSNWCHFSFGMSNLGLWWNRSYSQSMRQKNYQLCQFGWLDSTASSEHWWQSTNDQVLGRKGCWYQCYRSVSSLSCNTCIKCRQNKK